MSDIGKSCGKDGANSTVAELPAVTPAQEAGYRRESAQELRRRLGWPENAGGEPHCPHGIVAYQPCLQCARERMQVMPDRPHDVYSAEEYRRGVAKGFVMGAILGGVATGVMYAWLIGVWG